MFPSLYETSFTVHLTKSKMPSTRNSHSKALDHLESTNTTEAINSNPNGLGQRASASDDTGVQRYSTPVTRSLRRSLKHDPNNTRAPPRKGRNQRTQMVQGQTKTRKTRKSRTGSGEWCRINGILAHKRDKRRFDYLVSWWGYSKEHDQWLGERDLRSRDVIAY